MSRHLFLVLLTLMSVNLNNAIDIECECETHPIFGYGCKVTKIHGNECTIKNIHLTHKQNGTSEYDVTFLNITSDTLDFFPNGIAEKFLNIERLFINCEKINQITKNDLKPFGDKLKHLSIIQSSIVEIPSDLFAETLKISYLYIKSDKLENIQQNVFEPIINNLKTFGVDFPCFPEEFSMDNDDAKILIENIKISCYKPRFISNEIERNCSEIFDDKTTTLRSLIDTPMTTVTPQILAREATESSIINSTTQNSIIKINETTTKKSINITQNLSTTLKILSPSSKSPTIKLIDATTRSLSTTAKSTKPHSILDYDFNEDRTRKIENESETDEPQTLISEESTTLKSSINHQNSTTEGLINLLMSTTLNTFDNKSENSSSTLQSTNFTSKNIDENQSTLKLDFVNSSTPEITSNMSMTSDSTISTSNLTSTSSTLATKSKSTTLIVLNYDEIEDETTKKLENSTTEFSTFIPTTKKIEIENSTNFMNTTKSPETTTKNAIDSLFDDSQDYVVWVVGILLLLILLAVSLAIAIKLKNDDDDENY